MVCARPASPGPAHWAWCAYRYECASAVVVHFGAWRARGGQDIHQCAVPQLWRISHWVLHNGGYGRHVGAAARMWRCIALATARSWRDLVMLSSLHWCVPQRARICPAPHCPVAGVAAATWRGVCGGAGWHDCVVLFAPSAVQLYAVVVGCILARGVMRGRGPDDPPEPRCARVGVPD